MKKINLKIELSYDEKLMYGDNEGKDWFINDVLAGNFKLFSDELGDEIGLIKIVSIEKV